MTIKATIGKLAYSSNRKAAKSSRVAAFIRFRDCDLVTRVLDLQCDSCAARSHKDSRISRGVRAGGYFRSAAPAPAAIGFWLIMRCAYGVSAHMIQVPVWDGIVGNPVVFALKGHMIM